MKEPTFLIMWTGTTPGPSSGVVQIPQECFIQGEVAARELVGKLKEDGTVYGPNKQILMGRAENIRVFELPETNRFRPEDVPPGWTMEKANAQ